MFTVLYFAGEDVDLESGILTEKLGTSLTNDFERLKLSAVCNSLLRHLLPVLCTQWLLSQHYMSVQWVDCGVNYWPHISHNNVQVVFKQRLKMQLLLLSVVLEVAVCCLGHFKK